METSEQAGASKKAVPAGAIGNFVEWYVGIATFVSRAVMDVVHEIEDGVTGMSWTNLLEIEDRSHPGVSAER